MVYNIDNFNRINSKNTRAAVNRKPGKAAKKFPAGQASDMVTLSQEKQDAKAEIKTKSWLSLTRADAGKAAAEAGESAAPPEFLDLKKKIPPWRNLKVFLVHGSHTGGHRSAAESVKAVLDQIDGVDARVINALDYSGGKAVKKAQVKATDFVMDKMSSVRGWFFKQSFEGNPIVYWLGNTAMKIKSLMSKKFLNKIKEEKPDIILSCHSPMNSMLSYWKNKGKIDVPVHSVITDYKVHRMWAQKDIDRYYVATDSAKAELMNFGIPEDKIKVSGIPIKPKFATKSSLPKSKIKEKMGLDPDLPAVLMMGGSLGLGRFDKVAEALNKLKTPVQMVCITGKNETKKKDLEELSKKIKMPMKVLGYVRNVDEWMDACDMIISKPGGLTTSEIFAKKIPMIILDPTPGLEEILIPNIVGTGAAFKVEGPEQAAATVEKLINDPGASKEVMDNLQKVGKPKAAYTVGIDLVNTALDHN